jgi:fucose 4-O-acetylase-like acetyltransferase
MKYPDVHASAESARRRERTGWVDCAKGLGITLVVAGHAWRGLGNAGIVPQDFAFRFADRWVYAFHMPLFFFLAGLFLARSADKSSLTFFREKSLSLLYPFLLWTVLLVGMQSALGGRVNHRVSFFDLPSHLFVTPTLWFLPVLFLAAAVVFVAVRARLGALGIAAAFAGLWATWAAATHLAVWSWTPVYFLAENGIYVALGAAAGPWLANRAAPAWTARPARIVPALAFLAAALTACVWSRFDRSAWLGPLPACVGILMSLLIAMALDRARIPLVRRLGELSLPIYLASTFAMAGTRIALQHGLKFSDPATHLILGTAAGLIFPVVLAVLAGWLRVDALLFGSRLAVRRPPDGAVPAPRGDERAVFPSPTTIAAVRAEVAAWRRPPRAARTTA